MRALGIARVSTKEQATEAHFSFTNQRTRIRDYAAAHRWDLVDIVEYVQSGGSNRRELRDILQRVKQDRIEVVVVNELDRLARDMVSTMLFLEDLQKVGCRFASVADDLDLTTPDGELKMMMLAMFAHYFRRQLSRKVKGGQAERAKQGKRHGERPYGYRPSGDTWEPDPDEAPIVKQVYWMYLHGQMGFRAIAKSLNARGVAGHSGRTGTWDVRTIERMLRREAYAGDTIYGKWIQHRDRDGHTHITRQTPQIVQDSHPAIIDRETWNAVQERLARRKTVGPRSNDSPYLLSGIVRCGLCGTSMVVLRTGHRRPDGSRDPVFCCRAYHTKGQCSTATKIAVADLEAAVLTALEQELEIARNTLTTEDVVKWVRDDPELTQAIADRERAQQRLAAIPEMLARAEEMTLQGAYSIEEFKATKERLNKEREALEAQIAQPLPANHDPSIVVARLTQIIEHWKQIVAGEPKEGRPWVQALIDHIVCYPNRQIEITWRGLPKESDIAIPEEAN